MLRAALSRLPSRAHLRFLAIMMVGAYVLINLILAVLSHFTDGWPVWISTLVAVPLMVLGMVHVITPVARPKAR